MERNILFPVYLTVRKILLIVRLGFEGVVPAEVLPARVCFDLELNVVRGPSQERIAPPADLRHAVVYLCGLEGGIAELQGAAVAGGAPKVPVEAGEQVVGAGSPGISLWNVNTGGTVRPPGPLRKQTIIFRAVYWILEVDNPVPEVIPVGLVGSARGVGMLVAGPVVGSDDFQSTDR